jgi:hypothetical protein
LVEEAGGVCPSFWNPEVPVIEKVEHVCAELNSNVLGELRILDNAEIDILNPVRSQYVARRAAKALSWLNAVEIDGKPSDARK